MQQVSMMSHEFRAGQVLTAQLPGSFTAVRLPYRSGNFSAIAILPTNASAGPESLLPLLLGPKAPAAGLFAPLPGGSGGVKSLTPGALWAPAGPKGLIVQLPRFKLRARMSLVDPLEKLGVKVAFSDAQANFERAEGDPTKPFYVSDVVQEVRGAPSAIAATPRLLAAPLLLAPTLAIYAGRVPLGPLIKGCPLA
jgi:hypothetical protein